MDLQEEVKRQRAILPWNERERLLGEINECSITPDRTKKILWYALDSFYPPLISNLCMFSSYLNICKEKSTTSFMIVITRKYLSTHCITITSHCHCLWFYLEILMLQATMYVHDPLFKNKKDPYCIHATLSNPTLHSCVSPRNGITKEKNNTLKINYSKMMDFYAWMRRFSSHYIVYLSRIAFFTAVFNKSWEQFNFYVNPTRTVVVFVFQCNCLQ